MNAPIYFEDGFDQFHKFIAKNGQQKLFFIVDENTHEFCLPILLAEIQGVEDIEIIEIPAGESYKSIEIAIQVWLSLGEFNADRQAIIVNCGGGVITDFGGFIAATYKRGIRFINVPTSLLAMVDASVGAKTGINLEHFKNQIGSFYSPEMVLIFPEFLKTLPKKEILSGFAEMIKHALIQDKNHWNELSKITEIGGETLAEFIPKSIEIKKSVVTIDPKEMGLRKILNAGHTLGHAIESFYLMTDRKITHGEAVMAGLILESHISVHKNQLSLDEFHEIMSFSERFFPKLELPDSEQILPILLYDKKNLGTKINANLLNKIGDCNPISSTILTEEIQNAIDFYKVNYNEF